MVRNKALAYFSHGIVLVSLTSKTPQILRILRTRSVEGISAGMYLAELASLSISIQYHICKKFPSRTFLDKVAFAAQDIIILHCFVHFKRKGLKLHLLLPLYLTAMWLVQTQHVRRSVQQLLDWLQGLSTPIYVWSRWIQIAKNYRNRSIGTGELSMAPFAINFFGAVSRVITTSLELKNDTLLMSDYLIRVMLNLTMVLQILLYNRTNFKKE